MWAASMARTLRGGRGLEVESTLTSYGAQVAGEVDPLLTVPVGEQGVDGHHVLVEELPGRRAVGDRASRSTRVRIGAGRARRASTGRPPPEPAATSASACSA